MFDTKKKKLLGILGAALLLLLFALLIYWYLNPAETFAPTNSTKISTGSASEKKVVTENQTTIQTTEPVVDDTALITKALVAKTGIAADVIDVTVSTKTEKLAKGLVSAKGEEVGGGYFLAAKVNGDWVIVFDGQSTPPCASVDPYNFPASMVPECIDSADNIVTR